MPQRSGGLQNNQKGTNSFIKGYLIGFLDLLKTSINYILE
jgi:hypothetical protein